MFLLPQVILLLAQSEAFEFVLADRGDVSVVNAQKFTLGSHVSTTALFPIRPVALGVMEISVDAVSAGASDSQVWKVHVKVGSINDISQHVAFLFVLHMRDLLNFTGPGAYWMVLLKILMNIDSVGILQ